MYLLELEWFMYCIVIVEKYSFFDEFKLFLVKEFWLYVVK